MNIDKTSDKNIWYICTRHPSFFSPSFFQVQYVAASGRVTVPSPCEVPVDDVIPGKYGEDAGEV